MANQSQFSPVAKPASNPDVHVLGQLHGAIRRQWPLVLTTGIAALVLGALYTQMQVPVYRSSSTIMIASGPAITGDYTRPVTITPEEEGLFLSQMEMAKSGSVALDLAESLHLADDPAFNGRPKVGLARLVAKLTGKPLDAGVAEEKPSMDAIVSRLRAGMNVTRLGRTYVANLTVSTSDAALSARIADGWAAALERRVETEHQALTDKARAGYASELKMLTDEKAKAPIDQAGNVDRQIELLGQKFHADMASRAVPTVDVDILTKASVPAAPVEPRGTFILLVAAILGAAAGAILGGLREFRDTGMRNGRDVGETGLAFLGHAPVHSGKGSKAVGNGLKVDGAFRLGVDEPGSVLAETLRNIQVAAVQSSAKVIAITALGRRDGKSMIAANLATFLAAQGRPVALVDADIRNSSLSPRLVPDASEGLLDALMSNRPLSEIEIADQATNLTVLALGAKGKRVEPIGQLAGPALDGVMDDLRSRHDFVVIDCSSLGTAELRAMTRQIDGVVIVSMWGRVASDDLDRAVLGVPGLKDKALGLVLNRSRMARLKLYRR